MSGGATVNPAMPTSGGRICQQCGQPLAVGAAFCRSCGARYEEPPAEQPTLPPLAPPPVTPTVADEATGGRRPSGALVFLAIAIVLAMSGVATALLLSGNSGSSTTTVITRSGRASDSAGASAAAATLPSGSIEAGRYVQAGSFKFTADAEKERRRLASAGVDVVVVPSEEAQELYPGFQVLLGGPLHSDSEEAILLKRLHRNGVPSAFARPLMPALPAPPYSKLARGTWTGKLEESSTSHPKLDRTLPVTFVTSANGKEGTLIFLDINCIAELQAEQSAGPALRFGRSSGCFAGSWRVRPSDGKLMLTLLPPDSDLIVLGELRLP
jgi:hypothetical protein